MATHPRPPLHTTCTRRPCKAFMPQYHALAERFPDYVLLELTGDESPDMRTIMKQWQVRFFFYWLRAAVEF
jgi:hypothetical protein